MKKFRLTLIISVLFLTMIINSPVNIKSQVSNKLPYEFKLVCTGYYKKTKLPDGKWDRQYVKTDKEYVVLDFSKQSLSLFEVESVSNDREWYTRPKLDKNGNTIPLKIINNNADQATKIFNSPLELKVIGNVPNSIFAGFTLKKSEFLGCARIFNKGHDRDISISPISQSDIQNNSQFDSNLTFIYADTDLDYQIRKVNDKGTFDVSFQKSINPDVDDLDKYIGIREMVDYGYFLAFEEGKGYLAITPNKGQFLSNGRPSTVGYIPRIVDGKLFVYAEWFVNQVYGYYAKDPNQNKYIYKRLYQRIGDPIELLNIELGYNEDFVTLNGTKYKLSAKPIFNQSYTMMPLRDLCELLKVRLIYQPISNTYLIQRFNTAYDPPFNLKMVEN